MIKIGFVVKLREFVIPLRHIELNAELKFSKTDRAEVKGSGIALLEMI